MSVNLVPLNSFNQESSYIIQGGILNKSEILNSIYALIPELSIGKELPDLKCSRLLIELAIMRGFINSDRDNLIELITLLGNASFEFNIPLAFFKDSSSHQEEIELGLNFNIKENIYSEFSNHLEGAYPHLKPIKTSLNNYNLLQLACLTGNLNEFEILRKHPSLANYVQKHGAYLVYVACSMGHTGLVEALLKDDRIKKKDLNNRDRFGRSLFYTACCAGHLGVVQQLLKDDRIDLYQANQNGNTLFMMACLNGHDKVVKAFLEKSKTTAEALNLANDAGASPFFAACSKGHLGVVKELLEDPRIDLHQTIPQGDTPLLIACYHGYEEVVKAILKNKKIKGEALNQTNNFGESPFSVAYRKGHLEVVRQLLKDDRIDLHKVNQKNETYFLIACENGNEKVVEAFLENKQIKDETLNKINDTGESPFFVACRKGHLGVVKQLLEDPRIDLYRNGPNRVTPFLAACDHGHVGVVEVLLKDQRFNQDFNKENTYRKTPFESACEQGHLEVVKLLLSVGHPKIKLSSRLCKKVFARAGHNENLEVIKVLMEVPSQLQQPSYFINDGKWFKSLFRQFLFLKKAEVVQYLIGIGFRFALEEFFGGAWDIPKSNGKEMYKMLKDIIYGSFEVIRKNVTLLDNNKLYQNGKGLFDLMGKDKRVYEILVGAGLKGEFYLKKAAEQLLPPVHRGDQERIKHNLRFLRKDAVVYADPSVREELTRFVHDASLALRRGYLKVKNENEMVGPSISSQDREDAKNAARFFTIFKAVPREIQAILAHRVVNSPKDFIYEAGERSGISLLYAAILFS
jgi:ankyrin repeat protein